VGPGSRDWSSSAAAMRDQILFQRHQRNSPLADHKLASIEGMFTPPRLDYRNAAVKRVVDFHQAQQNEVIHDGADGKSGI
jgi:hypothetical protein